MNIIFCLSHFSVQQTIKIVKESDDDFLVITGRESIRNFLTRLFPKEKIIQIQLPVLSKKPHKLFQSAVILTLYKYNLWKSFRGFQNSNVYFFHVSFGELYSWLIKKLSIKNNVYYKPTVSLDNLNVDVSFHAKVGVWVRKLMYSVDVKPLYSERDIIYFSVSESYLKKIGANDIQFSSKDTYSSEILESLGIEGCKILILCGGLVGEYCTENDYIHNMDMIIEYLVKKYGHDAIVIKAHPQFPEYYSKENTLRKVPIDIPADMLVGMFEIVIGYCSATIIDAANSGVKSISLLRLIQPVNEGIKLEMIGYLDQNSHNIIHYPESVDELLKIV
jgi:hypothetical protein